MYQNEIFNWALRLLDKAKKSKTIKQAIQKTVEVTRDLIGNKIVDKIRSFSTQWHSKKSSKKLHSEELHSRSEDKLEVPKERYISPEKRQQIIDELRLL